MADNIQMPSDVGNDYSSLPESISPNEHVLCAGLMDIKQSIKDIGKSAYEIAVKNGFEGTEKEWLDSLHGKDGQNAEDSVVIRFSQDSCLFMGTVDHAIAASISVNVTATIGTKKVELTVGNILDTPTGMGIAVENNNTTDVTLKINVDETMSSHGVLNIPITVNDVLYAKGLSYAIAFQGLGGIDGNDGKGISNISQYYLVSNKSEGVTISDSGWVSGDIPLMTEVHKYLWEYEVILYTDNSSEIIQPKVVGIYSKGENGENGVGIENITNYYLASQLSSGVTVSTEGWTSNPQDLTEENKYLWNYEEIIYSNNKTTNTQPFIIGMYSKDGEAGKDGVDGADGTSPCYVVLGNENISIPCTNEGIVSEQMIINVPVYSYVGTAMKPHIITVTDLPVGITYNVTNGTLNKEGNVEFTISDSSNLGGANSGTININIEVNGQSFDKKFSWSKQISGKVGSDGNGISSSSVTYQVSSSGSVVPTGTWSSDIPIVGSGQYLWTKTSFIMDDGSVTDSYSVGGSGKDGEPGNGIVTTEITYQVSDSGVTIPTGEWTEEIPNTPNGYYLWTRTIIAYSNSDTSISYSISKMGEDGQTSRTYFIEPSTVVIKKGKNDVLNPTNITFSAFYRDGNSATRSSYSARFIIQESEDGINFTTKYTSTDNETVKTYTPSVKTKVIRCNMYASGGTTTMLDTQSVVIVSDVDGITIGGRNLLLGTKEWLNGIGSGTIQDDLYKGFKVLYYDNSSGTSTVDVAVWNNAFEVKANTYYTLSFWAKGTGGLSSYITTGSTIASGESNQGSSTAYADGGIFHTLKTDWTYYTITWKTLPNASGIKNCIAGRASIGAKVYICGCKLEESNVASDWTPSPDDVDTAIESAQSTADGKNTVFYQTSAPSTTNRKVNDIWFDTDDGNKMYYWNGNAWTAQQFGTNAIKNLSITNALIADGAIQNAKIGNLDAGKITTGTLSADRIGAQSIVAGKLAANTITANSGVIADAAITTAKIADLNVTNAKLANLAVTDAKIANATITGAKIADATIGTAKIADAAITNAKIGSLDASKITSGYISSDRIQANSIVIGKLADSAIKDINSRVEVGGRNLLRNSHRTEVTYTYPTASFLDAFRGVTTVPLNAGTYTLSFWAKSTVDGDKVRVHLYNPSNITNYTNSQGVTGDYGDGQCDFTLTTKLTKYWVTYTVPKDDSTRNFIVPRVFNGAGSGTLTFKWEKLEEGNKATDWTPAPEDVQTQINDLDSDILAWCYNGDKTYINGGKIYTGSISTNQLAANSIVADKIATGAVTANKINVSSLSAITANLGTVTSGTIIGGTITTNANRLSYNAVTTGLTMTSGGIGAGDGTNNTFYVTNKGELYSTSGSIAGWNISSNELSKIVKETGKQTESSLSPTLFNMKTYEIINNSGELEFTTSTELRIEYGQIRGEVSTGLNEGAIRIYDFALNPDVLSMSASYGGETSMTIYREGSINWSDVNSTCSISTSGYRYIDYTFEIDGTEYSVIANPPEEELIITAPSIKLKNNTYIHDDKQISRNATSTSWVTGRDCALLRHTNYTGYNPILSMKTTNGSWELGPYTYDNLYFSYILDSNYNNGNNVTTYQVKFGSDGVIESSKGFKVGNTGVYEGYVSSNDFWKNGVGYCVASPNGNSTRQRVTNLTFCNTSSSKYLEISTPYTQWGCSGWQSDKRLKTNILPVTNNSLDIIKRINHVSFDWKDGTGHVSLGYVADELEKIMPEAIFKIGDDKYKNIDHSKVIPHITKAIQELVEENDKLKTKVSELEQRLEDIESKLNNL